MRHSLNAGWRDLFGWAGYSWLFLPFGLLAAWKNWRGLLVGAVFPSLVFIHIFYWIGSELFGPRYYYEGLYSLTLFTALGFAWLSGWLKSPQVTSVVSQPSSDLGKAVHLFNHPKALLLRKTLLPALLILLVSYNLFAFLPGRLWEMHGLYGISRAGLQPFLTQEAQALTPALVIVHSEKWMSYGSLIELEDPRLTTPFIFAWSRGPAADQTLAEDFPERNIYHYYVDEPWFFYTAPKE